MASPRAGEVSVARQATQQVRATYDGAEPADGRRRAERLLAALPSCPINEIPRLGRALRQWRAALLGGANDGGAEAVHGFVKLDCRITRGFHNCINYRLSMLLIGRGFD